MTFWIPLMIALVLCGIFFTYLWQQFERRRELGLLSDAIERILRGEDQEAEIVVKKTRRIPYKDTFFSRICHKLNRLEQRMDGCYEQIAADRDSMKESITEIANQLRTPLNNLEVYLDFLEGGHLTQEEQARYLGTVRASEQKIRLLTENFLKMSRLENRMIRASREEWDLLATMGAAVELLSPEMKEKQIVLKTSFPKKLHFPHDADLLGEAVRDVLDNAVKYSSAGGKIELGARQSEMFTQIWVRDYGIGIQEGDEAKVFRRFYRAENAKEQEGFGIGLTIAREIVLQHDGFMQVVRQKDGTRVEIYMENS